MTKYYYDSNFQVIEERDGNDQVLKQYEYGNRIDEILLIKIFQGPYPGTYYYHTNGSGSVTAITDQEGKLVERVSYDAWGVPTFKDYLTDPNNPIIREYSVIGNEILWHGRRYDPETHMYYFRNRTYDPTMGRFLQTDPMGYKDSMNLYQAFNMNPVNFIDPFGRELYISGDATTLTIMKAWLNKIAGFLGNRNLLKFTKYNRDQFEWSGDSHDFPGYVDALEGTYKVEFITPQNHKYRENVGAWLISNLIESKKK